MATTTRKLSAAVVSRALKAAGMSKAERVAPRQFAGFTASQNDDAVSVAWVNSNLIRQSDRSPEMIPYTPGVQVFEGDGLDWTRVDPFGSDGFL